MTVTMSAPRPRPPAGILVAGDPFGQAVIADWFSRLVLCPLDAAAVRANRSEEMLAFVAGLADELGVPAASRTIIPFLSDQAPEQIERQLGHCYVLLFDGLSGPKAVSLCESAYAGAGGRLFQAPFTEMLALLRALDVSVGGTCREPADHLAIELAALAEATRQGHAALTTPMIRRLSGWVPLVTQAVCRTGLSDFYAVVFTLLDAFVAVLASSSGGDRPNENRKLLSGVSDV
ncbi:MAG: molecular chaperone TorD family protein [Azospirillaceae bacterium]|nr:molecular chaperone TorD family protein [Azospirillaceae bacterium]